MCMLSVFAPAHFWPSLKHLFSRCCSWQALHDIKSEILTENQTASRPLAATIHRLFFAVQICMFLSFLSRTCSSHWYGTNYFIIIHFVFCLFFFRPLTLRSRQFCLSCASTQVCISCLRSTGHKLDSICLSIHTYRYTVCMNSIRAVIQMLELHRHSRWIVLF